jgi:hypothetical protein
MCKGMSRGRYTVVSSDRKHPHPQKVMISTTLCGPVFHSDRTVYFDGSIRPSLVVRVRREPKTLAHGEDALTKVTNVEHIFRGTYCL